MPRLLCDLSIPLKDFHLSFHFNQEVNHILGVFGPSGAGKTTLLRTIIGLHKNTEATIALDQNYWQKRNKIFVPPYKRNIAYLSQTPYLFPHLNPKQNFHFAAPKNISEEYVKRIVELLGLSPLFSRKTAQLSGGEKQRLALGRAALTQPQMWLMDEPLSALDKRSKIEVSEAIRQIHGLNGAPVLYVTHSWDEICRLTEKVILIERGQTDIHCHHSSKNSLSTERQENILRASFLSYEKEFALACYKVGEVPLFITTQSHEPEILIFFRAEDVSIHLHPPTNSSISNFLPGKIVKIDNFSQGRVLIKLQNEHYSLKAIITQKSRMSLGLEIGSYVYGGIKSISLV